MSPQPGIGCPPPLREPRAPDGALILLYHRVADVPFDPQELCVHPDRFREHLEVLRTSFEAIPLARLATDQAPSFVALTFDDGYADNLHVVRPLLDQYDIPATVFVCPVLSGAPREFWWDELEFHLFDNVRPSTSDNGERWTVLRAPQTPRQAAYCDLCTLLRPLPAADRSTIIDAIAVQTRTPTPLRESHRRLTHDEIARLAQCPHIEIGAHTMTHAVLSACPPAVQRDEIAESKSVLAEIVGREIKAFSYPYGTRRDYTADTVAIVREYGFAIACSNFPGLIDADTDRFQLPRMVVRNWDGDAFARRLHDALAVRRA